MTWEVILWVVIIPAELIMLYLLWKQILKQNKIANERILKESKDNIRFLKEMNEAISIAGRKTNER